MSTAEPPVERGAPNHRDATYYVMPPKRRWSVKIFGWLLFAAASLGIAGYLYAHESLQYALSNDRNKSPEIVAAREILPDEPRNLPDAPWNLLIIGSDQRPTDGGARGRSDSLMLVRLDFKQNFVSILSFPRDLFVEIPGYGANKINAAYSLGTEKLTIETVQQLTGERVNHFFNVDFNAFRRLVNDAGGVYLDVDRWYFNDNSGRGENFEQLDIKPGYQRLGGFDALDYVRYRHGDSDFGRIARQQAFLAELKRRTTGVGGLNNILDAVKKDVSTSLTNANRLKDFILFGLETPKERIARTTIDTIGQRDVAGIGNVVDTSDLLIRKAVEEWRNPAFLVDDVAEPVKPADVIVWVYNGSKKVGVGTRATLALERKGYKAQFAGDAPEGFFQSTSIYYAPEKRNAARALQPLFGESASIGPRRQGQATDADVLVMVGGDFDGLVTPKKAPPAAKVKPDTIATTSLRRIVQNMKGLSGMDLLVPTHLPSGSRVRYVRLYNIERGSRGKPNAATFVVQLPGFSKLGGNRYMTITQTNMKDVPILDTATGRDKTGGGITYYNGRNMQRLLWRRGDMTYWVSNTLDESLTAETIRDIRRFMVRPGAVKLRAGERNTVIPIDQTGRTP